MNATDTPGSIPELTHPATPGKPCPGGGTCCNRSEFDRALYPCSQVDQLRAQLAADRRRAEAAEQHAAMAAQLAEEQIAARNAAESERDALREIAGLLEGWDRRGGYVCLLKAKVVATERRADELEDQLSQLRVSYSLRLEEAKAAEKKLDQERTYANDLDGCLQSIAIEVTGSPETAGLVCKIEELVKSRAAAESERDKWHKLCQDQCEVETAIRTMLEPIIGRDLAFGTTDGQEPLEDAVRAALAKIGGKQ